MRLRLAPLAPVMLLAACAGGPHPRALHYMGDELVYSRPAPAEGYEAYLRARLALEASPPRLDEAQAYIERALRVDPRDPHLWTTQAVIAWKAGDAPRAAIAAQRALELRPGYTPAQQVIAAMDSGGTGAAMAVSASDN